MTTAASSADPADPAAPADAARFGTRPPGPLDLVGLPPLMALGAGSARVAVAVVDGAVALGGPEFAGRRVRFLPGPDEAAGGGQAGREGPTRGAGTCEGMAGGAACPHGTFVAGLLSASRSSAVPGICPGCTLLAHPVFAAGRSGGDARPVADAGPAARVGELAAAVVRCVDAGARVLNLSVALARPAATLPDHRELTEALDHAAARGTLVVVAAGNQSALRTSALTCHPWTIPVIAYDRTGRPMGLSNLGGSIGTRGIGAPGDRVAGRVDGRPFTVTGTSAAAPFVTGAAALLISLFPAAPPAAVRAALLHGRPAARRTVVPPLLDAWSAYTHLASVQHGRHVSPLT